MAMLNSGLKGLKGEVSHLIRYCGHLCSNRGLPKTWHISDGTSTVLRVPDNREQPDNTLHSVQAICTVIGKPMPP